MPEPAAPRAGAPARNARVEDEGTVRKVLGIVQQVVFFYILSQLIKNYVLKPPAPPPPVPSSGQQSSDLPNNAPQAAQTQAGSLWTPGTNLTLHFLLSTSPTEVNGFGGPVFTWEGIEYGKWNESREWDGTIHTPESVMNNGTLWAHIFLVRNGASIDPRDKSFNPSDTHHSRKLLTRYMPRRKVHKVKSLLSGNQEEEVEEEVEEEPEDNSPVSYWHPNVTLTLVSDFAQIPITQLPAPVAEHVTVEPVNDKFYYRPILFPNDFWLLKNSMNPINHTTPTLPLHVSFYPLSYFKFQLYATMTDSFDKQPASSAAELDEVKRMLTETNPILLITTMIVTLLHGLFEILAFKNDISHWKGKKEMVGVSVRTIVTNVVVQLIILLYLIDNNAETSYMILLGQGTGMVIEAWKASPPHHTEPTEPDSLPHRLQKQ
ncbi:hypothetical protein FRC06_010180 [Ceratobasidium sp. 370]|nr:hypothetical protein FRC06_010180 [Ceratobasidium sp. 370]